MQAMGPYVSRGGWKLEAALSAMGLSVRGLICADLGCSTGGFTDCLLQHGARRVYSLDTAYGQFAWKLRRDERVTLLERTNALHLDPWQTPPQHPGLENFAGVDWVVIDLGWTRQKLAIPAALRWLRRPGPHSVHASPCGIITLIKPQYEAPADQVRGKRRGILSDADLPVVLEQVLQDMPSLGVRVCGCIASPIRGAAAGGKPGNQEFLAWMVPISPKMPPSPRPTPAPDPEAGA